MRQLATILFFVCLMVPAWAQQHTAVKMNYTETWSDASVGKIVDEIAATPFPTTKLEIIRTAVDTSELGFSADQTVSILKSFEISSYMADAIQVMDEHILGMTSRDVMEILDVLKFPSHKLRVLEVLRFTITDEENKFDILEAIPTQRDKETATKILKAVKQPRSFIYGTVKSDQVVFIVDISGSMNAELTLNNGQTLTRLDFVKNELEKVLKQYNTNAKFNVIFFSSEVDFWKQSMVNAKPTNRQDALDYISRQTAAGMTNIYDALETAFDDPEAKTIYFLTDGVPTAGKETNKGAILRQVRQWNNNRAVRIHTTAFLTGDNDYENRSQAKRLMRRLARQNDGIYRCID